MSDLVFPPHVCCFVSSYLLLPLLSAQYVVADKKKKKAKVKSHKSHKSHKSQEGESRKSKKAKRSKSQKAKSHKTREAKKPRVGVKIRQKPIAKSHKTQEAKIPKATKATPDWKKHIDKKYINNFTSKKSLVSVPPSKIKWSPAKSPATVVQWLSQAFVLCHKWLCIQLKSRSFRQGIARPRCIAVYVQDNSSFHLELLKFQFFLCSTTGFLLQTELGGIDLIFQALHLLTNGSLPSLRCFHCFEDL